MNTWKVGDDLFIAAPDGRIVTYQEKHVKTIENLTDILQKQLECRQVAAKYLEDAESLDMVAVHYMKEVRRELGLS